MVFKDYYKILDLKTIKVNKEEIKNAYRNQAKKYHPDINSESTDEIIKDINEAYKVLSNIDSKKKYDRLWMNYIGKTNSKIYVHEKRSENIIDELRGIFFGKINAYKKIKEEKLNESIKLELTIEETYNGVIKYISKKNKEIKVEIPEKTKENDIVIIKGKGKKSIQNPDISGDLICSITIKKDEEEKYKVDGLNLIRKIYITPAEAVLGTKKEIDIFGEKMAVIIPEKVKEGYEFKIKNKGFRSNNNYKGYLVIEVVLSIPEELSEEEIELYKKLNEIQKNKIEY